WSYAREFPLCDHYFTDVASISYPNHLFAIAATAPIINNPPHAAAPFRIDSLPLHLTKAGLDWRHYGTEAWHFPLSTANPLSPPSYGAATGII
ncbi:MAG: alkaline phosphatase family protein, partial [Chloroflexota bacterium]